MNRHVLRHGPLQVLDPGGLSILFPPSKTSCIRCAPYSRWPGVYHWTDGRSRLPQFCFPMVKRSKASTQEEGEGASGEARHGWAGWDHAFCQPISCWRTLFSFLFSRSAPDLFSTFFYAYTIVLRSSSRFWIVDRSR